MKLKPVLANFSNKTQKKQKITTGNAESFVRFDLTAIKRPISTDLNTTPKKAPIQATKSNLSTFHIKITASISIRPITADMIIEEIIAFGVYLNNGVISSNVNNTTKDITMFETAVLQPAMKFTADRENDPEQR